MVNGGSVMMRWGWCGDEAMACVTMRYGEERKAMLGGDEVVMVASIASCRYDVQDDGHEHRTKNDVELISNNAMVKQKKIGENKDFFPLD